MAAKGKGAKAAPEEDKNEPTRRQVLVAIELPEEKVAKALAETGFGRTPETFDPGDKEAMAKQVEDIRKMLADAEYLRCWVPLKVTEGDKKTAINTAVGGARQLGMFRAPALRAWMGAFARKPPRQIAPDEEALD